MLCEQCQKDIAKKVEKPGCLKCVHAKEYGKECTECIKKSNPRDDFPNFKAREAK